MPSIEELVVILEDGAFPQKDDVLDMGNIGFAIVTEIEDNNINLAFTDLSVGLMKDGAWFRKWNQKIIQRNGRPVIYKSALEGKS